MTRRQKKRVLGLAAFTAVASVGTVALLSSCEGLDYSARSEGTGVQIVGAIVVLAKYHANAHQRAVAEQQARATFTQVVQPEYHKRQVAIRTVERQKVAATEKVYAQKKAKVLASREPVATSHTNTPVDHPPESKSAAVAVIEQERVKAVHQLEADASAEIASLSHAWHSMGGGPTRDDPPSAPVEDVPVASSRDRDALIASAAAHLPHYIAVSVPAQGNQAEQGGKATIMLWDTQRQQLAGEDVLVLDRRPESGKTIKVEGIAAKFVSNF